MPTTPVSVVVAAHAVKNNPFAYFQSVQQGQDPGLSLATIVGFDGPKGLYADLSTGHVRHFPLIAPNQCNDQHGRGNRGSLGQYDPGQAACSGNTDGTLAGLNPGLSLQADTAVERIVTAIKHSPAWQQGSSAIVIVWDENDHSGIANPHRRPIRSRRATSIRSS